mgnify:CR=1 FL=1
MAWTSRGVLRTEQTWTVEAESSSGEVAQLACASEAQARYFSAVLSLRPSALPKQAIVRALAVLPVPEAAPGAPRRAPRTR